MTIIGEVSQLCDPTRTCILTTELYTCDHVHVGHPKPQDNEEPDPRESWSWSQLLPGVLVGILYFLASSSHPIPEVPFPFFLQQMLNAGEVRTVEWDIINTM